MKKYLIVTHYDNEEITTSFANNDEQIEIEVRAYAKETNKKTIKNIIILDLNWNSILITIERYGYFGSIDQLPKTQKFLHSKEFQKYWKENNNFKAKWEDFTNEKSNLHNVNR